MTSRADTGRLRIVCARIDAGIPGIARRGTLHAWDCADCAAAVWVSPYTRRLVIAGRARITCQDCHDHRQTLP